MPKRSNPGRRALDNVGGKARAHGDAGEGARLAAILDAAQAEDVIVGEENVEIPSSSLSAVGEVIAESSITSAKPENEDVSSSTLQDEQELSSQQHQFSEL